MGQPWLLNKLVASITLALVILLGSRGARAWAFSEHYDLGREAYSEVCEELVHAQPNVHLAYEHFRGSLDVSAQRRLDIACRDPGTLAHQYGQFVALSGDHLDIKDIEGLNANIAAKDFIDYLLRASHNAEHFHPQAPNEWRQYHEEALKHALEAKDDPTYLGEMRVFWKAFYLSAYGDHFLEDSFAAGHSGFNRPASTPSASDKLHGYYNSNGKLLRDSVGREWLSYGDFNLDRAGDEEGRRRVLEATKASVRDFIVAFVLGRRSFALENDADVRLPVHSNTGCYCRTANAHSRSFISYNRFADWRYLDAWDAELAGRPLLTRTVLARRPPSAGCGEWGSLLQVQEPASYAITHNLGVTQLARLNNYEHVLASTYSFAIYTRKLRFGMDLGWYWSTREAGNTGVLLAPTASMPLGGKYGTILAWDLDAKFIALFPAMAYRHSTDYVQHLAGAIGLGVSVQLGRLNLRASAGPTLSWSNALAVDNDAWSNPGFGWYSQLGVQFIFSPEGGGRLRPPPI
jgi:hypothetical protein